MRREHTLPGHTDTTMTPQLSAYVRLIRLHRPIGILLLLWPTLWALWVAARGVPHFDVLLVFLAGTVLMRSAGCAINDFADRDFDGAVERTQDRPLATGEITPRAALTVAAVLALAAGALVLTMNMLTIQLALVALLLAATYPFAKRYTYLPQLHLGVAFGWAVPMSFAAQSNSVTPLCWLIFCAAVLWAMIYDTEYAMVDRDDDLRIGVKSTAILFADNDRVIIGILQAMMLLNLVFIGAQASLRWPYYLALVLTGLLFGYQQHLIRHRDGGGCFRAFLNNNWVGLIIFAGIAASFTIGPDA